MTPNPELFRTAMSAPVETPMLPAPGTHGGDAGKNTVRTGPAGLETGEPAEPPPQKSPRPMRKLSRKAREQP